MDYRMRSPRTPKQRGRKLATKDWSRHVGSSSGLITIVVMTLFLLFNWLQKHFRPSDPDTMTNTGLEAVASSSAKMV